MLAPRSFPNDLRDTLRWAFPPNIIIFLHAIFTSRKVGSDVRARANFEFKAKSESKEPMEIERNSEILGGGTRRFDIIISLLTLRWHLKVLCYICFTKSS